jgi:hypothetical protein
LLSWPRNTELKISESLLGRAWRRPWIGQISQGCDEQAALGGAPVPLRQELLTGRTVVSRGKPAGQRRIVTRLNEDHIWAWPCVGGWHVDPRSGDRLQTGVGLEIGDDVIIGDRVRFGDGVTIGDGVTLGDEVIIGDGATLGDRVLAAAGGTSETALQLVTTPLWAADVSE